MDARLVAWARRVKARRPTAAPPPLWLFTDPVAHPDLPSVVAGLPRGLCGVVFRHDAVAGREQLGRRVARICRSRRLTLAVAGDWRMAAALRAGLHARDGVRPIHTPRWFPVATSSAHGRAAILRAQACGARTILVSPVFPTASHPGGPALGLLRWLLATRGLRGRAGALGGVHGGVARRLAAASIPTAAAVGAFGRELPSPPQVSGS